jgi:hypothetical protein
MFPKILAYIRLYHILCAVKHFLEIFRIGKKAGKFGGKGWVLALISTHNSKLMSQKPFRFWGDLPVTEFLFYLRGAAMDTWSKFSPVFQRLPQG